MVYQSYILGVFNIANILLVIIAASIALSLFKVSRERESLRPWKYLIVVLVLFAVLELVGGFRSFGLYESPYLTHVLASFMLVVLIIALVLQIALYAPYKIGK